MFATYLMFLVTWAYTGSELHEILFNKFLLYTLGLLVGWFFLFKHMNLVDKDHYYKSKR